MIRYTLKENIFEEIIGTKLLQIFVPGGELELSNSPQFHSSREMILVFQKEKNLYFTIKLRFNNSSIFKLKKTTYIEATLSKGDYPAIDFKKFTCSISNSFSINVYSVDIIEKILSKNINQEKVQYLHAIYINRLESNGIFIEFTDSSPSSFTISLNGV